MFLIPGGAASNQNETGVEEPEAQRQTRGSFVFLAPLARRVLEATCGVKECPVTRWAPKVRVTKSEAEGQKRPPWFIWGKN